MNHWIFNLTYFSTTDFTVMTHISIFTNLGAVFIVILRICFHKPYTSFEVLGVSLAILGGYLTSLDPYASKLSSSSSNIIFGDLLALGSSVSAAIFFVTLDKY